MEYYSTIKFEHAHSLRHFYALRAALSDDNGIPYYLSALDVIDANIWRRSIGATSPARAPTS